MDSLFSRAAAFFVLSAVAGATLAQSRPTNAPALASRPGAPYTLYLDFSGFTFTGSWMGKGSPGTTPAFGNATGAFTTAQQSQISAAWARVAEKYAPFNINITTIDPAVAALGAAATDFQRQAYYETTPRMMHTVVGGTGSWIPNGGAGYSAISATRSSYSVAPGTAGSGYHTNWVFAGQSTGITPAILGELISHENGHGLSLSHHCDCVLGVVTSDYSTNFGATGPGSYAPVMGSSYASQRGTWRVGTSYKGGVVIQNDVRSFMTNNTNIGGYADDGIGHSHAAATVLPLSGAAVNSALAKGVITSVSTTDPNPLGAANYTSDFFSFRTDGSSAITLTAVNGGSRLSAGVSDGGATLRSTLRILDTAGNVVATATEAADTLSSTFTSTLPAGRYVAQVASYGGSISLNDPQNIYYDMGSFFLTGSGFSAAKWTGPSSGDWSVATNWLGGALPAAGELASVPASTTVTTTTVLQNGLTAAGHVKVKPTVQGGQTSKIGTLSLTGAGSLDIADTKLVLTNTSVDAVRQALQTAFLNGTWAGPGLTSSKAAADAVDITAIAYATAAQLGVSSWGGVTGLTGSEVLARVTIYGDANLDGLINSDDFTLLDRGMRSNLSGWLYGDFDYSGLVDSRDLWLLNRGLLLQSGVTPNPSTLATLESQFGSAYVASLLTAIPEPTSLCAAVGLGLTVVTRRRR